MATTSPWNIPLFDGSSPFDPIQAPFNAQSDALNTALGTAVSAGDIKFSARATAPSGWLIADGTAISRTTYAVLFAAIGTAFGTGDGSTTFGLPDLRGRAPVGTKTGDANFGTLGAAVGSAAHSHPLSSAGQAQVSMASNGVNGAGDALTIRRVTTAPFTVTHVSLNVNGTGAATSQGTGAALAGATDSSSTIQPSIALTPLIKY